MNDFLVKHYLGMPSLTDAQITSLKNVKPDTNYITLLNKGGFDWTFEITNERTLEGGAYDMTVVLYLPGVVKTGIGSSEGKNPRRGALQNAIKFAAMLAGIGTTVVKDDAPPKTTTEDTTQDTTEDKPTRRKPVEETPPEQPKADKPKFSPEQVAAMKRIKEDYAITTDEMLLGYLKSWNKDIKSKKDLTPDNIDEFITWMENEE